MKNTTSSNPKLYTKRDKKLKEFIKIDNQDFKKLGLVIKKLLVSSEKHKKHFKEVTGVFHKRISNINETIFYKKTLILNDIKDLNIFLNNIYEKMQNEAVAANTKKEYGLTIPFLLKIQSRLSK